MTRQFALTGSMVIVVLMAAPAALAHVPYLENDDFSGDAPFQVENVTQSKALYAWLADSDDVDHYAMQVDEPTRIYLHTNIPFCREYQEFTVTYALTGPGLPAPEGVLPVELPEGHGAIVIRDEFVAGAHRPVMYEPFSARMYWEGPVYDVEVEQPGEYRMVVWHEDGHTGDYVAVIGKKERFGPMDIWRALTQTPRIRAGKELHTSCTAEDEEAEVLAARTSD